MSGAKRSIHIERVTTVHYGFDLVLVNPVCWDLKISEGHLVSRDKNGDYEVQAPRPDFETHITVTNAATATRMTALTGLAD